MMSSVTFLAVAGGHLAVTSRPKLRAIESLARDGCTHLVTLLAEKEHPRPIAEAAERAGIAWLWTPLENGDPPSDVRHGELVALLERLRDGLAAGGRVVIHCSAGIHRTGMIAYALLRFVGMSRAEAASALGAMRAVTAAGVTERRLAWGDRFVERAGRASDAIRSGICAATARR